MVVAAVAPCCSLLLLSIALGGERFFFVFSLIRSCHSGHCRVPVVRCTLRDASRGHHDDDDDGHCSSNFDVFWLFFSH